MTFILLNPDRAIAPVVLDGALYRLVIDLNAARISENLAGESFTKILIIDSLERARVWLFASLVRDAEQKQIIWTPDRLARLVSDDELPVMIPLVQQAILAFLPDTNGRLAKNVGDGEDERAAEATPWDWESALWVGMQLGLTPEQFWALTLRELQLYQDAAIKKREDANYFTAAMTANMMNVHISKGRVTAEKLLGRKECKPKKGDRNAAAVDDAKFAARCNDTSGAPIWEKLEKASQEAR